MVEVNDSGTDDCEADDKDDDDDEKEEAEEDENEDDTGCAKCTVTFARGSPSGVSYACKRAVSCATVCCKACERRLSSSSISPSALLAGG